MTDCSTCSITITTSVGNVTYCEGNIIILKKVKYSTNFDMVFFFLWEKDNIPVMDFVREDRFEMNILYEDEYCDFHMAYRAIPRKNLLTITFTSYKSTCLIF